MPKPLPDMTWYATDTGVEVTTVFDDRNHKIVVICNEEAQRAILDLQPDAIQHQLSKKPNPVDNLCTAWIKFYREPEGSRAMLRYDMKPPVITDEDDTTVFTFTLNHD